MRLVTVGVAAALAACYTEATKFSLLKKNAQTRLRRDRQPLVTKVNAFATQEEACCACFKSKYDWPANAGLGASFAPKQTCDTCYVTDLYGIDARAAVTLDVPRPLDDGTPKPPECADTCDTIPDHPGCEYVNLENGVETRKAYFGPGACAGLIADPLFIQKMTGGNFPICDAVGSICPTACGVNGCGAEAAYTKTESKVEAVHEWNWNCASGNAPEDGGKWVVGPVEGEPESTRAPFLMCKEDGGWYCPFEEGADLKLEAGADLPKEIDEGGSATISVATMKLPVIDGAQSVAASVTDE